MEYYKEMLQKMVLKIMIAPLVYWNEIEWNVFSP